MARRRTMKGKRRRVQSAAQGRARHERGGLAEQLFTVPEGLLISKPLPRTKNKGDQ